MVLQFFASGEHLCTFEPLSLFCDHTAEGTWHLGPWTFILLMFYHLFIFKRFKQLATLMLAFEFECE